MILPVCLIRGTPAVVNLLKLAGARRGILKLPGVEEDVGLIGIHWKGEFIELVPWNASVNWDVDPWGSWKVAHLPFVVQSLLCYITWHASVLHGCLRCSLREQRTHPWLQFWSAYTLLHLLGMYQHCA